MDATRSSTAPQHLLLAIVLAGLLLFAAHAASTHLLAPAPVAAAQATASAPSDLVARAEEANQAELRRARVAREQQLIETDRQRREQNMQAALAAREQADAFDRIERERKEQAWQRFYVKPRKCNNASEPAITVECSNHFLREQQRFEKQWAEGKPDKP
ncbi:hypothetical protein [Uliginosibacterium sp. TH139]|uniref:hypothetical protein n=1 Tax=Uliginosibacterium sp. TH139 TaxID=2067453 RepID=UPI000C7D19ED|nr:hypothetical protein [Uliginosibacterium sp. TH139]PLK49927.1 hypothetical protein C0V76_05795 [Uliginosibacterium sp. TH139]